jgi:hypothetical protein
LRVDRILWLSGKRQKKDPINKNQVSIENILKLKGKK